jgi:hypothetical protein
MQTELSYLKCYLSKISQAQIIKQLKNISKHLYALAVELLADLEMNFYWRAIVIEFEHLLHLFNVHGERVRPGTPLPRALDMALGALEVYLVNIVMHRGRGLQTGLLVRPGFEYLYDHILSDDGLSGTFKAKEEAGRTDGLSITEALVVVPSTHGEAR